MNKKERKSKIRLTGNPAAFEYIKQLWKSGELEKILGVGIANINLIEPSSIPIGENLSRWFDNIFGKDWLELEEVSISQPQYPAWQTRRNNNNFYDIGRAKIINLGTKAVALVMKLQQEQEETSIGIEVMPVGKDKYLPPNLKVKIELESDSAELQAKEADELLRCDLSEFSGKQIIVFLELDRVQITEKFVV